jgi:hypothetical protein
MIVGSPSRPTLTGRPRHTTFLESITTVEPTARRRTPPDGARRVAATVRANKHTGRIFFFWTFLLGCSSGHFFWDGLLDVSSGMVFSSWNWLWLWRDRDLDVSRREVHG